MPKLCQIISAEEVKQYFLKNILIPTIIQEASTGEVLMLAYMNEESLIKTIETGYTWFYSRSRKELWNKGATSGHWQKVFNIMVDCDNDTLLIQVEQIGSACHTGAKSCFYRKLALDDTNQMPSRSSSHVLNQLYEVISQRQAQPQEGSYTSYLFNKGLDKILKKCGEECSEVIIAAKNQDKLELTNELSDLVYHLFVLMNDQSISLEELISELENRSKTIGNLKTFHYVDKNS